MRYLPTSLRVYLILLAVSPPIKRFSIKANIIITGTIAITEVVNMNCHSRTYNPRNCGIATVKGCNSAFCTKTKAAAYSFQVLMNTKTTAVTIPGHTS